MNASVLRAALAPYRRPDVATSLWQLGSTLALYALAWAGAAWAVARLPWLAPLVCLPAAALLVRLFIVQHDCGHGSFLPWRWANEAVGLGLGVLTLAPYHYWRQTHALHHGNVGDLNRRGELGYIPWWTVEEYGRATPAARLGYRLIRTPWILVGLGLPFQFLIWHRLPLNTPREWRAAWGSVLFTDVALAGLVALGVMGLGATTFGLTAGFVGAEAAAMGGWLFYLQHNFEGAYVARGAAWDPGRAALEGSSYLDLPAPLAWLSGDIGLHHVHHLDSQIPNYRLRAARLAVPEIAAIRPLRWAQIRRAWRLRLYDEAARTWCQVS